MNIKIYWRENFRDLYKNSIDFARECLTEFNQNLKNDFIIKREKFGKPIIENFSNLWFNISHSKNIIVCAIANKNIGIDCQFVNIYENKRLFKISKRFFGLNENDFLRNSENLIDDFFDIWTKKEAYVKFTGQGLSGLKSFDVFDVNLGVKFERLKIEKFNDLYINLCYENIINSEVKILWN